MLKTDNIWGVAALHGAWNFAQGNLVGVSVSGQNAGASLLHFQARSGLPDWLSGGAFGLEGNIVTCLVLLVGIIILRLQLKKKLFKAEFQKTRSFYFCVKIEESLEKGRDES